MAENIKIRGYVLFELGISLKEINSNYNEFMKKENYSYMLENILKELSKNSNKIKCSNALMYIYEKRSFYKKLTISSKIYILFPRDARVEIPIPEILILLKKGEKITKEEIEELKIILAKINEALKLATK